MCYPLRGSRIIQDFPLQSSMGGEQIKTFAAVPTSHICTLLVVSSQTCNATNQDGVLVNGWII